MARRLELDAILRGIAGDNVYFQPPDGAKMSYPCIVYQRDNTSTQFAGNLPYRNQQRYQVTLISRNPDQDAMREAIEALPTSIFNRYYSAEGLNHDVFLIYY